jgi:hypothetical protein
MRSSKSLIDASSRIYARVDEVGRKQGLSRSLVFANSLRFNCKDLTSKCASLRFTCNRQRNPSIREPVVLTSRQEKSTNSQKRAKRQAELPYSSH